jgi:multidrug efflux system membrane fusion protein
MNKPHRISLQSPLAIFVTASFVLLAGCSKPVEKAEEIRPVRVMQLGADNADLVAEFSGDVHARIESRLGFRVGGKIVSRKVDVGTPVRRGQVLMQLDQQDLQLAQAQANAGLRAAQSNRDLAKAELARYKGLHEKNFVSQAVLDQKDATFKAAQASVDQAQAAYRGQANQAGYAVLVADVDGVVTAVDAEIGQVVAAGTPVVRVAQAGEKEVVIGIPEDKVDALRSITDIQVRIWANPKELIKGRLRELSPVADPATRTYSAKVAIDNVPAGVKLGMTAYVRFVAKNPDAMAKVPLTALFHEKSTTSVWVVEGGAVKRVPVQIAGSSGDDVLLSGPLSAGQQIVTAGVNQLKPGQKVSILGEDTLMKAVNQAAAKPLMQAATRSAVGAGAAK